MATEWWWFLIINAIVAAVAVLSVVRPPLSPRGDGITRRASSVMLQRLRSSIFSFPSASFHTAPTPLPHPLAGSTTTAVSQETEEPAEEVASTPDDKPASTPRPRAPLITPRHAPASAKEEEGAEKEDPNAMSMEEAYALVVQAARRQPEREVEAKSSRSSDVDAKAEEFIQRFKEGLRQQRLNSIFNYTQMLKKRAFGGGGGRQPAAQPDQR